MNWTRFLFAVLASGFVGFLSDGAFMGSPFIHKEYAKSPEVWRPKPASGEGGRIALLTLLTFVSAQFLFTFAHARKFPLIAARSSWRWRFGRQGWFRSSGPIICS